MLFILFVVVLVSDSVDFVSYKFIGFLRVFRLWLVLWFLLLVYRSSCVLNACLKKCFASAFRFFLGVFIAGFLGWCFLSWFWGVVLVLLCLLLFI